MTEVRTRTRPAPPAEPVVRSRVRPSRERNVDVEKMIADGNDVNHFENALPGIHIHCGLCRGDANEGPLMGRIVHKGMDRPARVFAYKSGNPNDPASYHPVDVAKNYDEGIALLRRKHKCGPQEEPKKRAPVAKPKAKPAWATGTDLSKVRTRARKS